MNQQFTQPKLLLHPNIPPPLHGTNPRTILGQQWWDKVRQIAYRQNNYHCWACGIHKSQAKYHQWLEAHEIYDIDYAIGKVELKGICALCHSCHNYIHDGRMQMMIEAGTFDKNKYFDILKHGNKIVKKYLLSLKQKPVDWKLPFEPTFPFQDSFPEIKIPDFPKPDPENAPWPEWHLVLKGIKYYTPFETQYQWASYYESPNRSPLPIRLAPTNKNFEIIGKISGDNLAALKHWCNEHQALLKPTASNYAKGCQELWIRRYCDLKKNPKFTKGYQDKKVERLGERLLPGFHIGLALFCPPSVKIGLHRDCTVFEKIGVGVNLGEATFLIGEAYQEREQYFLRDGDVFQFKTKIQHGIEPVKKERWGIYFWHLKPQYLK